MTQAQDLFHDLRDTLAGLFPAREEAELLARDARLGQARLPWAGNAETFWQAALGEAETTGLVEVLLTRAVDRAAGDAELPKLRDQYRAWVQAGRPGGSPFPITPPEPPRSLLRLRPPVADFTGRADDVRTLVDAFSGEGAQRVATIFGMDGIGKTELALKVAETLSRDYPDAGLLFELQPGNIPLTPAALLGQVIHAYQPELRLTEDLAALQALYRQSLIGQRGALLLDNAADAGQVSPLLPPPTGWAVMVTSRGRFALPGAQMHALELLSPEEAVTLLHRVLTNGGRTDVSVPDLANGGDSVGATLVVAPPVAAHQRGRPPESPLQALAEACGRLPLALRVAGNFLVSYPNRTLARYLALLEQSRRKYLAAPDDQDQPDPVFAVLRLSVDTLRSRNARLATAWHALAVFPAPFDLPAAAAVWNVEEVQAEDDLSALLQQSLVEYDRATQTYSLHDLLAELAREMAVTEEVRFRHADYYLERGRETHALYLQGGPGVLAGLQLFDTIWPHLLAGWRTLAERTDERALQWRNDMPDAVTHVLDLRVPPSTQIEFREGALAAARGLGDQSGEDVHLGHLGNAYAALGEQRRAIDYYEQALAIKRETGRRGGEGADLGNLGRAYMNLGVMPQAIAYYKQALAFDRAIGDRRGEGQDLNNLGAAYLKMHETRQAIVVFEQSLRIKKEIGDRRGEGNALGNLGNAYAARGEPRRAIDHFEQTLVIAREIGDRRAEGNALVNMGAAYETLNDKDRAGALAQEALHIYEEIQDPHAAMVREWLAGLEH